MSLIEIVFINTKQKMPLVDNIKRGVRINNCIVPPLELAYCASLLKEHGINSRIIDANTERFSNEEIITKLETYSPKLIVINSTMIDRWLCPYLNIDAPLSLSESIKKNFPYSKIAIIGPHGTNTPNWVLRKAKGNIDIVVKGEPEITVTELSEAIIKGNSINEIPGLAFYKEGKFFFSGERERMSKLDELPFPYYDKLPMHKFESGLIVSSRGCPHRCTFCTRGLQEGIYRWRSAKNVVDEMELLEKKYNMKRIYFQDLEFTVNKNRTLEICKEIKERGLSIKWGCSGRFDDIKEKSILEELKSANMTLINFGLESGSETMIKNCNKKLELNHVVVVSKWCKEIGIKMNTYLICAMPGETKETLDESIRFIAKHDLGMGGGNLPIPYPGTELHAQAIREGFNVDWNNLGNIAGKIGTDILKEITEEELYKFITITYFKEKYSKFFYLNPVFWIQQKGFILDYFKKNFQTNTA